MARDDAIHGLLQRGQVQLTGQAYQHGNVVERAARLILVQEPEPLLGERQRQRRAAVGGRDRRGHRRRAGQQGLVYPLRHVGHGGVIEHGPQRHLHAEHAVHFRDDPRRQQRMPPHREEVAMHPEPACRHGQQFQPDRVQCHFGRRHRLGLGFGRRPDGVGRRQALAIQLAVRQARQGVQRDEQAGNHELRQPLAQPVPQCLWLQRQSVAHNHIGQQLAGRPRLRPAGHHRLQHRVILAQRLFDLAHIDTMAAQLDLEIFAPQVLQAAVRQIAHQIARAVQARARPIGKRMGNEAFGGQVRLAPVAARDTDAVDAQLARHADRHLRQRLVQHIHAGVGDRLADGGEHFLRRAVGCRCAGAVGHVVQFGATEVVPQLNPGQRRVHLAAHGVRQRLAGRGAVFERPQCLRVVAQAGQQRLQMRRHQVHARDLPALQHRREGRHVLGRVVVHKHQRHAAQQAGQQFLDRHREGDRRFLGHHFVRPEGHAVPQGQQPVDQLPMRHHHPFGAAGGAGGIHQVRQLFGRDLPGGIGVALRGQGRIVEAQRSHREALGQCRLRRRAHQPLRLCVVRDVGQVAGRVVRIQRHHASPGLEDAEQPDQEFARALGQQSHPGFRLHTQRAQTMRQLVGPRIELRVAQRAAIVMASVPFGRHRRLPLEQANHRVTRSGNGRVVPFGKELLLTRIDTGDAG
ncbi:hypothetical protein DUGA6_62610 [Duganella sp. HH105]|nr:hypothetical protein DUGA6_62610 [Duganella sp. HH105]